MTGVARILMKVASPGVKLAVAWAVFLATLLGWPLSLWLTNEPPVILSLSWGAVTVTAWAVISTAEVRVQQDEQPEAAQ